MLKITKFPLPSGQSYVLKTSVLERALANAELEVEVALSHGGSGRFYILAASWNLPNHFQTREWWSIHAGSVTSEHAFEARRYVESHVLPELMVWMRDILARPENALQRQQRQRLDFPMPARFSTGHQRRSN